MMIVKPTIKKKQSNDSFLFQNEMQSKNEFYENGKTLYHIFKFDIKYEGLFLTSGETIYKYNNKN